MAIKLIFPSESAKVSKTTPWSRIQVKSTTLIGVFEKMGMAIRLPATSPIKTSEPRYPS